MRPSRSRSLSAVAALMLLGVLFSQCNMTRFVVRRTGPAMERAMGVLTAYKDPELARQASPALLALLEGLLASDPDNPVLLRVLCQGIYEYTFGFIQSEYERLRDTEPDRAERFRRRARMQYIKVYELGLRLLSVQGVQITLQKSSVADIRRQLKRLDKRAVPALAWTAAGAGGALLLGIDQPWLMQMHGKIPILLTRAAELNPAYANGLPVAALGLYYGRDTMTGGSAIKSQRYFQQAIQGTRRRYLMWLVLYARYWAWQFQSLEKERVGHGGAARYVALQPKNKRQLFARLLAEVKRFPLSSAPEHRLANTIAERVALRIERLEKEFLQTTPPPSGQRRAARGETGP